MRKFLAIISGCTIIFMGLVFTARAATGYFPSFVPNLGVGGDTIMGQIVRQLDAWVPGSSIFAGSHFFDTTNVPNPAVYVNTQKVLSYTGSGLNFTTNGTQTGAVILADSFPVAEWFSVPCTATGGTNGFGGYYNTCNLKNPYNASGSLAYLRFACRKPMMSITNLSGGWLNATVANATITTSGPNLYLAQPGHFSLNKTVGTGGHIIQFGSGGRVWNPANRFVIQTGKVIPKTLGVDCRVDYQFLRNYAY